ncbi:MAG TPA: alkaline phosphatase family protein [Verrucomicrobiae bacterium]|nr:alkaline phosphatase family protein [Verrucomicrobiae bacterium]
MKTILPLFVFIDACGWEIIRGRTFAQSLAPHRKRLDSVFGYSSACVPSIVSGHWPVEHRNWCYFVYDPAHSPFQWLRPLRWLPRVLTSRRRFRWWLSKAVKARLKFNGYFDLYNIPFQHISLYDFTEKKSPLQPLGMNRGTNIFDFLRMREIAYHVSDPRKSETDNLENLITELKTEQLDFAFVYLPEMDGLLHRVGNDSPEVPKKLQAYELWIERLLETAQEHYESVRLYIFSDHGMANCDEHLDLRARIDALPLKIGKDYAVVYDSTMARFWFFNEPARTTVSRELNSVSQGRVLSDAELDELHCLFPDRYFGELIFLVKEGVLIVPSHMGERPIRAMHGYHPRDPHSYAALLSNQTIPENIHAIPDIHDLMTRDAELAKAANAQPKHLPDWHESPAPPAYAAAH